MPLIPKGPSGQWAVPEKYEVKTIIGSGSYGSVCEAYDKEKDLLVAIKRVKHMFDDLIDCKRILREISILNRLSHPHIVEIYDIVQPPDIKTFTELYIVMEICASDLKKLIRTDVTLSPLHIDTVLYNLLVGCKYLHSAGIYHRDLKPANVLVNQDCSVKICDFGLSRAVVSEQPQLQALPNTPRGSDDEEGERGEPQASGVLVAATARAKRVMTRHVVTRWYRAPELILLQDDYNEAIDMWSVGCIYAELMQMLEGWSLLDRGPLFPGKSCFPLSPDHRHQRDSKFHTKGTTDQLNVIFHMLGTPSEADIEQLQRDDAKRYIRACPRKDGEGIKSRFSSAPPESVDLLEKILKFMPRRRITVSCALEHPIFAEIRDPEKETTAPSPTTLEFDKQADLDEALLRKYFAEEISKFHSGVGA